MPTKKHHAITPTDSLLYLTTRVPAAQNAYHNAVAAVIQTTTNTGANQDQKENCAEPRRAAALKIDEQLIRPPSSSDVNTRCLLAGGLEQSPE
jgi:hypothetical protein